MNSKELKKILAGLGIASLVTGGILSGSGCSPSGNSA